MASFRRLPPFRLQNLGSGSASKRYPGNDNDDPSASASLPLYNPASPYSDRAEKFDNDDHDDDENDDEDQWEDFDDSPDVVRNMRRSDPRAAVRSYPSQSSAVRLPSVMMHRSSPYRVPGRIMRYLCMALALSVIGFIGLLVRASILENRSLVNGTHQAQLEKPAVWTLFPLLTRYYGGLKTLRAPTQVEPQYPMAVAQSQQRKEGESRSETPVSRAFDLKGVKQDGIQQCFIDADDKVSIPSIHVYDGRPHGFPNHVVGSYDLLSLTQDVCLDRYGRYAPYGLGYSSREGGLSAGEYGDVSGINTIWKDTPKVNWDNIDWANVQRRCYHKNAARFNVTKHYEGGPAGFFIDHVAENESNATSDGSIPRTALVLRCWDEYKWTADDILNMRALISEVSLASGGQYDVHLLVQVKNEAANPIWADPKVYKQRIIDTVPKEFQGMVTLWSETQMLAMYQGMHDTFPKGPDLPLHGVYRGLQMGLQIFASHHPEYEYFWQWEMDLHYIGHYLEFFTNVENWTRQQPRKGLWERNARFYLPKVHGSWEEFSKLAETQTTEGVPTPGGRKLNIGERLIWGPERPRDPSDWFEVDSDPVPPAHEDPAWGVGEEADLITFSPIFDPERTQWGLAADISGYKTDKGLPPRRAFITAASRMSKRLVTMMHRETAFKKHFAFPEMWPSTVALHHGYKAVYVPHPLFVDRAWDLLTFASTINRGKNGASGGAPTSVFGTQEQALGTASFFYRSDFAGNMYRAWMGLQSRFTTGQRFETTEDAAKSGDDVENMKGGEGRMCLPPMLLHPIKDVDIPVEKAPGKEEAAPEPEFDPGS
ncbi:hypothetical protein TD95_000578 [Thielaviopsis punctulata]|uniref:Glycosyl transferase CAP10 domain-containing protein n=1 Tax=Thielaviopsis punctulata TaxID=72032 RepID=A0A0F4ZM07_9PEZI|nr:hypothetical protein TD95_000578 [Thielaviopsis punctulata]